MLLTTESPIIVNRPDSKFQTFLFLPEGEAKEKMVLKKSGIISSSYKLVIDSYMYCHFGSVGQQKGNNVVFCRVVELSYSDKIGSFSKPKLV